MSFRNKMYQMILSQVIPPTYQYARAPVLTRSSERFLSTWLRSILDEFVLFLKSQFNIRLIDCSIFHINKIWTYWLPDTYPSILEFVEEGEKNETPCIFQAIDKYTTLNELCSRYIARILECLVADVLRYALLYDDSHVISPSAIWDSIRKDKSLLRLYILTVPRDMLTSEHRKVYKLYRTMVSDINPNVQITRSSMKTLLRIHNRLLYEAMHQWMIHEYLKTYRKCMEYL